MILSGEIHSFFMCFFFRFIYEKPPFLKRLQLGYNLKRKEKSYED